MANKTCQQQHKSKRPKYNATTSGRLEDWEAFKILQKATIKSIMREKMEYKDNLVKNIRKYQKLFSDFSVKRGKRC